MRTRSLNLSIATAAIGLTLAACGAGSPTATNDTPSPSAPDSEVTGGGMAMCAPGVTDCDDMVVEEDPGDDRIMSPEVTIVTEFVGQVAMVEQAPGSVAEPFALFLQEAVVDGRTVTVSFSGGETPCFVVDHVALVEAEDAVTVSVLAGQPDPDADCSTMQTSLQAVSVELSSDLGARPILDGSRTAAAGDNV